MKKPSLKPAMGNLKPAAPKAAKAVRAPKPMMPTDPDGDNDMPMMKKGGRVKGKKR